MRISRIKTEWCNRLSDSQKSKQSSDRHKEHLRCIQSCNNFLSTFWTIMKIFFSLRWLNTWDILYTHFYKVPFPWDSKGCCWFLLKKSLFCNPFLKVNKESNGISWMSEVLKTFCACWWLLDPCVFHHTISLCNSLCYLLVFVIIHIRYLISNTKQQRKRIISRIYSLSTLSFNLCCLWMFSSAVISIKCDS